MFTKDKRSSLFCKKKFYNIDSWYGMPFNTTVDRRFNVSVEVNSELKKVGLKNVVGVIPGRWDHYHGRLTEGEGSVRLTS